MLLRMIWVRLCVLYVNTYILLSAQKGVLEEILRVYNVGAKGVKWKRGYAYIRSMGRDRSSVENTRLFFTTTTPRRWTAISMGALRRRNAIGSLSTDIVPIFSKARAYARCPRFFFYTRTPTVAIMRLYSSGDSSP